MPLLKRKPFPLAELPDDLESNELVYQVRTTKEIFRDYGYPFFSPWEAVWLFCFSFLLFL